MVPYILVTLCECYDGSWGTCAFFCATNPTDDIEEWTWHRYSGWFWTSPAINSGLNTSEKNYVCCLFAERRNNYKYLLFVGTVTSDWLAARIQSVFRNCISINLSLPLYFSSKFTPIRSFLIWAKLRNKRLKCYQNNIFKINWFKGM